MGLANIGLFSLQRVLAVKMMKAALFTLLALSTGSVFAQSAVKLPAITVYSEQVANQAPAGTFAMPVSALRFGNGGNSREGM